MPQPNIAIIKWTEDSFLQIEWDDGNWSGEEFTLLHDDDSYHELTYSQVMLASLDHDVGVSTGIVSFTVNDNISGEDAILKDFEFEKLIEVVQGILDGEAVKLH